MMWEIHQDLLFFAKFWSTKKASTLPRSIFLIFFFIFVIIFSNKVTKCLLWIWRLGYSTPTPITVLRWNLFSVKKNWHSRKFIPAKSQSQSVPLAATGESLYIPVKSYFWGHSQNIDKKFSKFAWKSENLATIFLDRES